MSVHSEIDSLKGKIAEALESGRGVMSDAEYKVSELNDIISELELINSHLEDNESALDDLQDNLDALDAQKDNAEEHNIYASS